MKKQTLYIIAVLLSLILILCACTRTDDDKDTDTDPSSPTETETDTAQTEPAFSLPLPTLNDPKSEDKTELPEYGYLADAMFDTDGAMPEYDIPASYMAKYTYRQLYSYGDKIYTYMATDTYDGFITVTDKETLKSAPLCTVPSCEHAGKGCEAYIYGAVYGFRVYDGMLYWVQGINDPSSSISLVRCDLDGTGREVVWNHDILSREQVYDANLKNENKLFDYCSFFESLSGVFEVLIHRGYIYFAGMYDTGKGSFNVACMPLAGGEPEMIFAAEPRTKNQVRCHIAPFGNDVYIMTCEDVNDGDDWMRMASFYRLDTKTREREFLGSAFGEDVNMGKDYDYYIEYTSVCEDALLPVEGDGLYFLERFECRAEIYDWEYERDGEIHIFEHAYTPDSTVTLCRLAFDTGEIERIAKLADGDFESFFAVCFENGVVEAHSHGNLYTFDLTGKLTGKRPFLDEYEYPLVDPAGADGDGMYFLCEVDGEPYWLLVPYNGGELQRFTSLPAVKHEMRQPEPGSMEEQFGAYVGPITVNENGEEHTYDGTVSFSVSAVYGSSISGNISFNNNDDKKEYLTYGGYSQGKMVNGYRHTMFELRAAKLITRGLADAHDYQHMMYITAAGEGVFYYGGDELMRLGFKDRMGLDWLE